MSMHNLFKKTRFLKAARDVCVESNQVYTFRCTRCGFPAKAIKNIRTGKINARCTECGYTAME